MKTDQPPKGRSQGGATGPWSPPPISQEFKGRCLTTTNMRPLPLENPGYAPEPPFPPVVGRFELKIKC